MRDCVVPFMIAVVGRRRFSRILAQRASAIGASVARRNRDAVKAVMVKEIFAGQSVERVSDVADEFSRRVTSEWMRNDVSDRLRFHQEAGHVVVLVSASLDPYLTRIGGAIGADAVLCTTLEVDGDHYTGELLGANCRGAGKVAALEAWGGDMGERAASWLTYAYGDSSGDAHMLNRAVVGVNVARTTLSPQC